MGDDRPVRYIERDDDGNETVVYRASGYGGICERALLAIAQGLPGAEMPAWFREVLDEGTLCEGEIDAMHDAKTGVETVEDQAEVELEIGEINDRRVIIRGHIDGMAATTKERIGREYKKFRDSTWPNFQRQGIEVNKNYPWQASVYWHALKWDALEFVGGHIAGYTCAKNVNVLHEKRDDECDDAECIPDTRMPVIGEVECKVLHDPPIPFKDIRRRIVRLERIIAEGSAPMDMACPDPKNYPCPFYKMHDEDDAENTWHLPTDKRTAEVVQTLVNVETQRRALAAELKSLDEAKKKVAAELREIVGAAGREADEAKELVFSANGVTHTIVRKRFHSPAKTIKAYDVDSFAPKQPPKPKTSRVKPRAKTDKKDT